MRTIMLQPVSTYRIQFNKEFTFRDFQSIIPYLKDLGVKTIYASPILEAGPGSMHGYDGVNPNRINPEIGTEEEFRAISKIIRENAMTWIQDIVPNHMSYHPNNVWLMDVFEKGAASHYYTYFDIKWNYPLHPGRVMAPFLGSSLEDAIAKNEIRLSLKNDKLYLNYFDVAYPLSLQTYIDVLGELQHSPVVQPLVAEGNSTSEISTDTAQVIADKMPDLLTDWLNDKTFSEDFNKRIQEINNSTIFMQQLSDKQVYRLCSWEETDFQINFRRFFTINSLICLNIQHEQVFKEYHRYVHYLMQEGLIDGLRIDHIDGLHDPEGYLKALKKYAGDQTYIVVEKILESNEKLPNVWQVEGNTGYDFLSLLNGLFTNKSNEAFFTGMYGKITGDETSVATQVKQKKANILYKYMGGELDNLTDLFEQSHLIHQANHTNLSRETIKALIAEILIICPIYRYYGNEFPLRNEEAEAVGLILEEIKIQKPELTGAAAAFQQLFIETPMLQNSEFNTRLIKFYQRLMQFSGPLMAKGVEDTLMYTYNRFIGSNEVGSTPENFGLLPEDFHREMVFRQKHWPVSLNATSTHDTKRGEDASARLNALSDMPDTWKNAVREWQKLTLSFRDTILNENDVYFIYQALLSTYPLDANAEPDFASRFEAYIIKALREGKTHTNWTKPEAAYEKAATYFANQLLDKNKPFWKSFESFLKQLNDFGIVNSLSKVLLKFTCPGTPDTYQGTEFWDLSMVDPDNRRSVNYAQRNEYLAKFSTVLAHDPKALVHELWTDKNDGGIKLWLTQLLMQERRDHSELFDKGTYLPLKITGKYKHHVFAFARVYRQQWFISVIPLNLASLCKTQKKNIDSLDWKDTAVRIPDEAPLLCKYVFLHKSVKREHEIAVKDLFQDIPLAFFKLEQAHTDRSAGILMHITSLPSAFGVGDFGPEAYKFADFLYAGLQKFWQILPLNVTTEGSAHSPYSSVSSMAGNALLISPELLAAQGLLDHAELLKHPIKNSDLVNFTEAADVKHSLLSKAYDRFKLQYSGTQLDNDFQVFRNREAEWLKDFCLFVVIKQEQGGKPWYQWPDEFKLRNESTLNTFINEHQAAMLHVEWEQYIFFQQWHELKSYCNHLNIQLFGDLPFYVSYDSADVWSNPGFFSLDEQGNMTGIAGVPPDYFNEDGQLWGMPVFKWEALKETNYDWWIRRIRKNMELYDVLRLDHFRAFADYWDVPATEKTAKNGQWKTGPGKEFFEVMKKSFPNLPFIAEDLGDIHEGVHALRDDFNLPGMKVLQFAFGDDIPESIYIPHNYTKNYIAYTGTHDNNTTVGWYRQDAGKTERNNLEKYFGMKPGEKNIHLVLGRMAYASVAKTAILPIQDLLGLDETARMNIPASTHKNWVWRLKDGQLTEKIQKMLKEWVTLFNR